VILDELLPPTQRNPIVSVHDGHPHTLAFLAAVRGDRIRCLGVTEFGQSSSVADAFRIHGIDGAAIIDAALGLLAR
jgi:pyruvate dehydrogenase E1 component